MRESNKPLQKLKNNGNRKKEMKEGISTREKKFKN